MLVECINVCDILTSVSVAWSQFEYNWSAVLYTHDLTCLIFATLSALLPLLGLLQGRSFAGARMS